MIPSGTRTGFVPPIIFSVIVEDSKAGYKVMSQGRYPITSRSAQGSWPHVTTSVCAPDMLRY